MFDIIHRTRRYQPPILLFVSKYVYKMWHACRRWRGDPAGWLHRPRIGQMAARWTGLRNARVKKIGASQRLEFK